MLERKFEESHHVVAKFTGPDATFMMDVQDQVVRVYGRPVGGFPIPGTGPFTVFLPSVSVAKGKFYSILCLDADPVNTVTITDQQDSECWGGDIVMDGRGDRALFYSDGRLWHALGGVDASALTFAGTTDPATGSP